MSDGESDWESGSEDEWLYMEDHFDEADELAEHQCPSPQPLEGVVPDYDAYEYFQDIEYLSDGGFNDQVVHRKKPTSQKSNAMVAHPKKRKRATTSSGKMGSKKKRKLFKQDAGLSVVKHQVQDDPVVVWLSNSERNALLDNIPLLPLQSATSVVAGTVQPEKKQERNTLALPKQTDDGAKPQASSVSSSQPDSAIAGDGFDLGDISSIAGLLSAEHIESLKSILTAQGLDADALDVVLRDLLEGRDREEGEEDEEDGN